MSLGPMIGEAVLNPIREGIENTMRRPDSVGLQTTQIAKGLSQIPEILTRAFSRSGDVMQNWGGTAAKLYSDMQNTHTTSLQDAATRLATIKPYLDKMTDADMPHLWDVLEAKAQPKNQLFADAKPVFQKFFNDYADNAQAAGLKAINGPKYQAYYQQFLDQGATNLEANARAVKLAAQPFEPIENYAPHYFSDVTIHNLMNSKEGDQYVQKILDMGFTNDPRSARAYLERSLRMPGEFRGGPLTHLRSAVDLDTFDKKKSIFDRYAFSASKRIQSANTFGPNDEGALQAIEQAVTENPKANKQFLANTYAGFMDSTDPKYRDLARLMGTIHSLTLLSTAGIVQPAQMTNTIGAYGWGNTIKAMSSLMNDQGMRDWSHSTGATLETISNQLMGGGLSDISKGWMQLIGLEKLDKANRMVAAVAGSLRASEVAKMLAENPLSSKAAQWTRELGNFGLNASDVRSRGGVLLPEELKTAGLHGSINTQFSSQAYDLPELRNTPAGRFMYMFKSFALQQSYFLKGLMGEARQGNRAPILRYLGAVAPAGLAYGPVLRAQKGRDAPDTWPAEALEDMAWVGGGGAFFDAWRAMDSGPQAIFNWIAGPSMSEATQFAGADVPPIIQGLTNGNGADFQPLVKHLVRRAPIVGPYIYNTWFK